MTKFFGRTFAATIAMITVAGMTGAAWAQQISPPNPATPPAADTERDRPTPPTPGTTPGSPGAATPGTSAPGTAASRVSDALIVAWVNTGNQGEIALSQLGQQHAQNQQVKQFAQQLNQEHKTFMDRVQGAVSGTAATPGAPGIRPGAAASDQSGAANLRERMQERVQERAQERVSGYRGGDATAGRPFEVGRVIREVGQRAVSLTEQELSRQKGSDFDKAFIGQQIASHIQFLATLETLQNYASPQLRSVLNEGVTATQKHLDEARKLMAQLESATAKGTASLPSPTTR